MGVAAQGRQAAYGARPIESRKLMALAASMTEVAWWRRRRRGSANARAIAMAADTIMIVYIVTDIYSYYNLP